MWKCMRPHYMKILSLSLLHALSMSSFTFSQKRVQLYEEFCSGVYSKRLWKCCQRPCHLWSGSPTEADRTAETSLHLFPRSEYTAGLLLQLTDILTLSLSLPVFSSRSLPLIKHPTPSKGTEDNEDKIPVRTSKKSHPISLTSVVIIKRWTGIDGLSDRPVTWEKRWI